MGMGPNGALDWKVRPGRFPVPFFIKTLWGTCPSTASDTQIKTQTDASVYSFSSMMNLLLSILDCHWPTNHPIPFPGNFILDKEFDTLMTEHVRMRKHVEQALGDHSFYFLICKMEIIIRTTCSSFLYSLVRSLDIYM